MSKKRIIALLLAVVFCFSLMAGCASPSADDNSTDPKSDSETPADNSSDPANNELPTIRIGWQTTPISAPCYYADQQGWFDDVANLDIAYFSNGYAVNEALAAEEIDMSNTGGQLGLLGCVNYDAVILGWAEDNAVAQQVYARNDNPIVKSGKGHIDGSPEIYGTPEDWKGQNLITTSATSGHFAAMCILKAMGLDPTDVTVTDMEASSGSAAFLAGEGDLYASWDPNYSVFENDPDNYTCVGRLSDSPTSSMCCYVASREYVSDPANHETIVGYLKGIVKASDAFVADSAMYKQTMIDWINEYSEIDDESGARSADIRKQYTLAEMAELHKEDADGNSRYSEVFWELIEFMYDNGLIDDAGYELLSENNWIDLSFMQEAIEEAIKEA